MNAKIVKNLRDGETGELKPYTGHVDQISWDPPMGWGCYMYHVSYDDDSDEEDMEH